MSCVAARGYFSGQSCDWQGLVKLRYAQKTGRRGQDRDGNENTVIDVTLQFYTYGPRQLSRYSDYAMD